MNLEKQIMQRLRTVLPEGNKRYELHEPTFGDTEFQFVNDCIRSGWVSSAGQYVNQFESQLSEFTGAKYVIATVNGTAALHMCFLMSGVEANEEVLIPTLTFVATANAVAYCRAIPHFVDSEMKTFGIDADALASYLDRVAVIKNNTCFNKETGRRIRALCVTHIFGQPADLDALLIVCQQFHLILIEDAAEALGSYYKNCHVGNVSRVAALSFNGNKIITTGGGGAVLTNDEELAKKIRHLTTTAKVQHAWNFVHDQVGYNYRLPNINAALGCAQLTRIEKYLTSKRHLARSYQAAFEDMEEVEILNEMPETKSNYWLNALILKSEDQAFRDSLLSSLSKIEIASRPIWELMHRLPMYRDCPRMNLTNSESLWKRVILLPSSPQ